MPHGKPKNSAVRYHSWFSAQPPQQPGPRRQVTAATLAAWAGFTLALCGLVFALVAMRRNRELTEDIQRLRQSRVDLLSYVEESNREIDSLSMIIDSLTRRRIPVPESITRRFQSIENLPAIDPASGFPLSFDAGVRDKRLVALTFDGGSFDNAAAEILDTLASRNVRGTMFITGEFIRKFPETVRRIVAGGHETGNHLFSHPHLTSYAENRLQMTLPAVTPEALRRELAAANDAFSQLTGKNMPALWRAPYGEYNRQICRWARDAGWLHVGWGQGRSWRYNLDSNDWIGSEDEAGFHTPGEVMDKIIALAEEVPQGINGGIILMHLGTIRSSDQQVHRILGRLIDELSTRGYRFVTISEMIRESGLRFDSLARKSEMPANGSGAQ